MLEELGQGLGLGLLASLLLALLLQQPRLVLEILAPLFVGDAGAGKDLGGKGDQVPKTGLLLLDSLLLLLVANLLVRLELLIILLLHLLGGGREGLLVLLEDGEVVEVLALLVLGLDGLDDGAEVLGVLLGLGPLVLGQQLVLDAALDGAANAEDAVVALLFVEAGQGRLDGLGLLGDEVVGSVGKFVISKASSLVTLVSN